MASGSKGRVIAGAIARLFRVSDSVQNSENASRAFLSRGDEAMFSYRLDQDAPMPLVRTLEVGVLRRAPTFLFSALEGG